MSACRDIRDYWELGGVRHRVWTALGPTFRKKYRRAYPFPTLPLFSNFMDFRGFCTFLDGVLGSGIPEMNFRVCVQLLYPLWVFSRSRQFLKHRKHMKNTDFQANFDLSVRVAERSYRKSSTDDNRAKGQPKSAHSLVGAASRRLLASA